MKELTEAQRRILEAVANSELAGTFYLTGGSALSAFYLHHRHSDDLDLFRREPVVTTDVLDVVGRVADGPIVPRRREHRLGLLVPVGGETVRVEFTQYDYAQLEPPKPLVGRLRVDGLRDILANKLSAIIDHNEPKDFADVYFLLTRAGLSLQQGMADATAKFGWPAIDLLLQSAFLKIDRMTAWPELEPPVTLEEACSAFRGWARSLIRVADD